MSEALKNVSEALFRFWLLSYGSLAGMILAISIYIDYFMRKRMRRLEDRVLVLETKEEKEE